VSLSALGTVVRRWLVLAETEGLDEDAPEMTLARRQIIREKPFLRRIYEEWYDGIRASVPDGAGAVLELGSGPGFMSLRVPGLITSEILHISGVDMVADARALPFRAAALRGIVMTNVLHHIPDARQFFAEAARVVASGGVIVMIEPWVNAWSTFVYRRFHVEPFEPAAPTWDLQGTGPLSSANAALPWILFQRDRARFECEFPHWRVASIEPHTPLRYLLSGGVSMRNLVPAFSYPAWRLIDRLLGPSFGMFAKIVIVRQ
jgi:SAM-dependent methyltransferase